MQEQAQVYRSMWQSMGTDPSQLFRAGSPLRTAFGWTYAEEVAGSMFDWFQQLQTYVGLLTCVLASLFLRWTGPGGTFAEIFVFELYVTAQATLFLGLLSPLCFLGAPALIGALPLLLQTGLHAYGASILLLLLGSTALSVGLVATLA